MNNDVSAWSYVFPRSLIRLLLLVLSACSNKGAVVVVLVRRHMKSSRRGENSPIVKDLLSFARAVMQLSSTSTGEDKPAKAKKIDIESAHEEYIDQEQGKEIESDFTQHRAQVCLTVAPFCKDKGYGRSFPLLSMPSISS